MFIPIHQEDIQVEARLYNPYDERYQSQLEMLPGNPGITFQVEKLDSKKNFHMPKPYLEAARHQISMMIATDLWTLLWDPLDDITLSEARRLIAGRLRRVIEHGGIEVPQTFIDFYKEEHEKEITRSEALDSYRRHEPRFRHLKSGKPEDGEELHSSR